MVPEPALLELRGVRAAYDGINVLHGVDLQVGAGQVVAVLGPNGAGKTTTLRVAAGLHPASGGDVMVAGRRINGASPDDLARCGLCLIPEGRGIFPNLTVQENLWMMTYGGTSLRQVEEVAYARFPRLRDRRRQTAGTLSGGEQQMLALARGLATDPALLILDELSMGLAPLVVEELFGLVSQVAGPGRGHPGGRAVRQHRAGCRRSGQPDDQRSHRLVGLARRDRRPPLGGLSRRLSRSLVVSAERTVLEAVVLERKSISKQVDLEAAISNQDLEQVGCDPPDRTHGEPS